MPHVHLSTAHNFLARVAHINKDNVHHALYSRAMDRAQSSRYEKIFICHHVQLITLQLLEIANRSTLYAVAF